MRKEIKKKVADHMRKFPGFKFPDQTEDGSELIVFDQPVELTDEEGEMLAACMPYFESAETIANRAKIDKNKAIPLLDSLVKKIWLFSEGTGDDRKYSAHTCRHEFYMPWLNSMEDLASLFSPIGAALGADAFDEKRQVGVGEDEFLPYLRVIPRESALPLDGDIPPEETVSHIIKEQGKKGLAATDCLCRTLKKVQGKECALDGPIAQCIFLHPFAQAAIEAGVAKPITQEKAFELIERAREHGLVHQGSTSKETRILCSCCSDCCGALMATFAGTMNYSSSAKSNFYSQVIPEACVGAKDCIKRCPAKAISFDKEKKIAAIDLDKCIGCGICVETCSHNALKLKRKDKILELPQTNEDHLEVVARQTGKMAFYKNKM